MSFFTLNKDQLVNLDYSLTTELLCSNQANCYLNTSLSGCNTRKYHGLLIAPASSKDHDKFVLLSSLDESIILHDTPFNLGIHKYEGEHYHPQGHKYMLDMEIGHTIKTSFKVGGVTLIREYFLVENKEQMLIRYSLESSHSEITLHFKPFLAFRNIHALSKRNYQANTHYKNADNGVAFNLYANTPQLYMQFSKQVTFNSNPNWYNNIEYFKEKDRGYEYLEDLLVPGHFETKMKQGDSIIFSASTTEIPIKGLVVKWANIKKRKDEIPDANFLNILESSASQFLQKQKAKTNIIAGYPWYEQLTRQALIALPGIVNPKKAPSTYECVLDTKLINLKDGLLPKVAHNINSGYDAIDTPLWSIYALQQYGLEHKKDAYLWEKYGGKIKEIITAYKKGTAYDIGMDENFLISSTYTNTPLSWMNSVADGKACVNRKSTLVEVNALWYNALCYTAELARAANDLEYANKCEKLIPEVKQSFIQKFWNDEKRYLADSIDNNSEDWSIRPNMVIAAAMRHSPLSLEQKREIIDISRRKLLTSRGLRSLCPEDHEYEGIVLGKATAERERIIHKGAIWPWLTQFFADAYLQVDEDDAKRKLQELLNTVQDGLKEHAIGSISEMYSGNPPHAPRGAVSYAASVASIIRTAHLLGEHTNNKENTQQKK